MPVGRPAPAARASVSPLVAMLVALVLIQAGVLALALLVARTPVANAVFDFDVAGARAVHSLQHTTLTRVAADFTALGTETTAVMYGLFAALVIGALAGTRRGVWLAVVVLGGYGVWTLTRELAQRPRPELFRLAEAQGYSFPSGHALMSVCLFVGAAIAVAPVAKGAGARAGLTLVALLVPLAMGFARLYQGVHNPSDVLAGWAIGLVWVLVSARVSGQTRGPHR